MRAASAGGEIHKEFRGHFTLYRVAISEATNRIAAHERAPRESRHAIRRRLGREAWIARSAAQIPRPRYLKDSRVHERNGTCRSGSE
jgi:hypothetical protein